MAWVALLLAAALMVLPDGRPRLPRRDWWSRRASRRAMVIPLALVGFLAVWLLPLSVVLAAAVAAATLALRAHRRRVAARDAQALSALESGLEVLVGELRVGAHPVRAFAVAANEVNGPVGEMFAAMAARARIGIDPASCPPEAGSLGAQWTRVARGWELAHRHGLAVGDLLTACRTDLVEQQRFTSRVEAGLAGARATATVLTGLPLIGVGLGQLIGAGPIKVLLSGGAGGVLLVAGVLLACLGLLWADAITGAALR